MFRAGVEIKLKEGWHTYWRYPGDSGVPPVLDFSKSRNVKAVTVLYPAPSRFPDGAGGNSIGYNGVLILPLHVVPQDAGKPRVVVDVAAPAGAPVVLFAEGPTPQWALPLPEPVTGAPAGQQRFAFELDGLPPGEKADGASLRLTAVAGGKAVEVGFRLD